MQVENTKHNSTDKKPKNTGQGFILGMRRITTKWQKGEGKCQRRSFDDV
jgi:hypothetical protein